MSYGLCGNFRMKIVFSEAQVDGTKGCPFQDCKDVTKVDPADAAGDWDAHGGSDSPAGKKSINTTLTNVVQSDGVFIRVGTIGCSLYRFQRQSDLFSES